MSRESLRENVSNVWAWTKLVAGALVVLYVLLVLIFNRNAVIDPGLTLLFVRYDRPPAVWSLLLTAVLAVAGFWLFVAVYRTLRKMKDRGARAEERRRLERAERELAEIKSAPKPGAELIEAPIPLEPSPAAPRSSPDATRP